MKLLLTGAGGFTGLQFRERAELAGYSVVPLQSDLTDARAVKQEVLAAQPDYVMHLAGIAFVGHSREEAFYAVNALGTTNLLDALLGLSAPPKMTVLASSANVYGNCAESPIPESQPPAPVNHYAMSKLAMEYMARTYMDRLKIVISRPFNYTGRGQNEAFVIPKLAKHFAKRLPFVALGNLHVEREFNDVRSVCAAYLLLLRHGDPGQIYNVCSGQTHSLREIIAVFEKIACHRIDVRIEPSLIRTREVHCLCGDARKLTELVSSAGVRLNMPTLEETLITVFNDVDLS